MSRRFPDFFLIGAPKCGTTSLFSWLQKHPDTYLPAKEPGFLSLDLLDVRSHPGGLKSEAEYLARLCPSEAQGKLTGESTPKYLYSDAALAALAPHAGQIKLIVMLRNPVDLAISMHAQNVREGREREADFARAWARGPAQAGDALSDYHFWGQPGSRLERWLAIFPREDIKFLILEEKMSTDPAKAHADILAFLGLAPQELETYAIENPRRSYRSPRLQGASRRAWRASYGVLSRLGIKPQGTGVLRLFDRLNGNRPDRQEVSAALRAEISETLTEDVKRIARLLGRDSLPWPDFDWDGIYDTGQST